MNMNQLINMVIRLFVRKALNSGFSSGINMMGGKWRKQSKQVAPTMQENAGGFDMTPAEIRVIRRARREQAAKM